MKRRLFWLAAAIMVVLQIGVLSQMIGRSELTLRYGQPFKFRLTVADPLDFFRGRYVLFSYQNLSLEAMPPNRKGESAPQFATIDADSDGYARVANVSRTKPKGDNVIRFTGLGRPDLPDRFYLNEDIAPEAEKMVRSRALTHSGNVYALVRLRNGKAAIENVYVGDVPIADYIRQQQRPSPTPPPPIPQGS